MFSHVLFCESQGPAGENLEPWNVPWDIWMGTPEDADAAVPTAFGLAEVAHPFPKESPLFC